MPFQFSLHPPTVCMRINWAESCSLLFQLSTMCTWARIHRSWAILLLTTSLFTLSLFTFYRSLLSAIIFCHFHVIGIVHTLHLPYLTTYCTLPRILTFITLHLTLPYLVVYLISYLLLPYILPYLTLLLTLHFAFCYLISYLTFCLILPYLTLPLTLCFALPYLTLPYILPYVTS